MARSLRLLGMIGGVVVALGAAIYGVRIWTVHTRSAVTAAAHESMNGSHTVAEHEGASITPRADVTVDTRRQQLIGVRTVAAKQTTLTPTIRTVGVVRYDERRQADVNVKLDGWIRDLYVDYTGQPIRKGQPLFTFYSPDLLATENEYLLALKTRDQLQHSGVADARDRADQLVASARQRLKLWDVSDADIRAIDESRQAEPAVTFRAPVDGIVIDKQAVKGMHVTAGQTLYKVADLSVVWVEGDIYEGEMSLARVGGRATVTFDAYPAEQFVGRLVYIYPYVDERTRTNKVRYEFANRRGQLKPGMFAHLEIAAPASRGIAVPMNAVLDSGTEQLVFVAKGEGVFEPRHVKIGRRIGDDVEIVEGIKEGEQVASGAAFFLDSESQLRAAVQGYEAGPGTSSSVAAGANQVTIAYRSTPDPPTVGENQFEVAVKDASGKALDGADVAVQFFMPAMPTMGMPAMRNEVKLTPAGGGVYRGTGQVMMAGRWETTIVVSRGGERLGMKQLPVVAK